MRFSDMLVSNLYLIVIFALLSYVSGGFPSFSELDQIRTDVNIAFGQLDDGEKGNDDDNPNTTLNTAIDGNNNVIANNGSTISNSMKFAFSGTNSKGVDINHFECNIDNSKYVACTSPFIFSNLIKDGTHTFTVLSEDNTGNKDSTPASFRWTVDTLAPLISINTATDGNSNFMTNGSSTSSNSMTFIFSGNDTGGKQGKGVGIKQFECSLDGASFSICTSPVKLTSVNLPEGIHTFEIMAEDSIGNINSSPESFTWTVDTEPPITTIDSSTDGYKNVVTNGGNTHSNSIIFAFSAKDSGGKEGNGVGIKQFECNIDNSDFASCSNPLQFKNLGDGTHTLEIVSEDNVGNISPTPASYSWTIDTLPPTTTITTAIDGNESSIANGSNTRFNSVTFAFGGNDTGGNEGKGVGIRKYECSLDNSNFTTCTSPLQFTSIHITPGTHTFEVLSEDNVGNNDPSPTSFNWTVDTIAPTTTINTVIDENRSAIINGSNTKSNSVTFGFSSNDTGGAGVDHLECSLDGSSFTTCTSPVQLTPANITDGTHTFDVSSEDNSTNKDPSPASFTWTVDTVPPETSILSATDDNESIITAGQNTSSNSVAFEFSSNETGGAGVDHLDCSLDGAPFATCTSPVQLTPANITDGTHTFDVSSEDNSTNKDPSPASFTWNVDTTAPTTTINTAIDGNRSDITNGSNTKSDSVTFEFSSNDTSGVGVDHFECSLDGAPFTTCTSPVQLTPANIFDGAHTFRLIAQDKVGNIMTTPVLFNWTVDSSPPITTINTAIDGNKSRIINDGSTNSTSMTFEFSANDIGGSEDKGVGIKQFECSIDNSNFTTCTSPIQSNNLTDGIHTLDVLSEDELGNRGSAPTFNWTIDTKSPSTSIFSATDGNNNFMIPGGNTSSNSVNFEFSANDTGGSEDKGVGIMQFECSIDNSNFTACSSPIQSNNSTDGDHILEVRAQDNVGNMNPTPAAFSWTVDTVPPTTTINTAIDDNKSAITNGSNTKSDSVTFEFSSNDTGGVGVSNFECSIDNSNFSACTNPVQAINLTDGDHILEVKAQDNVGNIDLFPAAFSWTVDTAPPLTSINSAVDGNKSVINTGGNTSSNSVTLSFSGTDSGAGINHFECRIDNSEFVTCISPLQIDNIRDGTHTLEARAHDNVGNNDTSLASLSWTVDTAPPLTSINSALDGNKSVISSRGNTSSNSTIFTFSAADTGGKEDKGVGISHFECNIDNSNFVTCTSPLEFNSLREGIHSFKLFSEDNVRNMDPTPASFNWTVDTTPPFTSINSATDGNNQTVDNNDNSSSTSIKFNFTGNDSDGVGVNHLECSLDGAPFATCTSPIQYSSTSISDGAHILEVRAQDNVGNISPSPSSLTWTVDTVPPDANIDSATDGNRSIISTGDNTSSNSMRFEFSGNDTGGKEGNGVGINNFECSIDNSNFTLCTSPIQSNNLTDGDHVLEVRAQDNVGNISPSPSSFTWTVDTTPPATTIDSATDDRNSTITDGGNTNSTSTTFIFSGNDTGGVGVSNFECSIDNSNFTTCTSPIQSNNSTDGDHILEVRAQDNVGNMNPTPAAFSWTVDTTPPATTINSVVDANQSSVPNGASTKSTSITFAFSGTDTGGVGIDHFDCKIDNSDFFTCTSSTQLNSLKDGAHILEVRAKDSIGNISPSASSFTWTVDTTPPATSINSATDGNKSAVTNGGTIKSTSMTFNFSGTDTGGVDHFECSLDNSKFTVCTSPIQFTSINLGDGTHTFKVLSEDNSTNKDPSPASFTWNVDTVPPTTTLAAAIDGNRTSLGTGGNTSSSSMTFAFSANDTGGKEGKGVGINHFECNIDNSKFVTCTSPFTFPMLLKDGTHTFNVFSVDNSRNKDASPATFTWNVDTTPPATSINSATDGNKSAVTNGGTINSTSMTFAFSGNDTGGVGIDHFECNVDGLTFVTCTSPFTFPSLSEDGQYTMEIRAHDGLGNKDASPASFTWTVDTSPPTTAIDSATDGNNRVITSGSNTSSKSMIFLFSSIDSGVGVDHSECSIDNSNFTVCASPIQFTSTNLGDGPHILHIRSEDKVGNRGSAPTFNWTIDTKSPSTSIFSATDGNNNFMIPGGNTSSNSVTFEFSANDTGGSEDKGVGIKQFECSIDNSNFTLCTSPIQSNNSTDGDHILEVRAEDNAGNMNPTPAAFSWTVDTVPSTTTINTAIDGNKSTITNDGKTKSQSMTFTFSGNDTDGVGIDHLECSIDKSDFVTCTSPFTFPDLLEDGTHTFSVLSEDMVGNIGSSPASFNWTVDTVSPSTRIDSVTDGNESSIITGGNSSSNAAKISFSGIDTGGNEDKGVGINHFECSLDGASFSNCTAPLELNGLIDGSHTIEIRASDNVGNNDASPASFIWSIDTVQPTTSITAAVDGNRNNVTAGGNTTSTSITFAFSGTDIGTGVNHFECSLDGASSTTCTSPVQFSDLADGAHTLEVTAEDNVVNVDASPASFAWTIDTIPPTTSIDSVVDTNKNTLSNGSYTRSNSITFAFSGSDTSKGGLKGFECSIDNSDFVTCASPYTFPKLLSDGPHTFNVRAADTSGNNDNSPELFTWNVDTTPAPASIDTAFDGNNNTVTNSGNTTSTSMTFSFSASDIGVGLDHFKCSLDGESFTTCTSPVQFNSLSDGSHTLEVTAEDKVGNIGSSPASFNWTVDTVSPTTRIDSATDGNKSAVTNGGTTESTSMTFAFSGNDTGGAGIDHFECNVDDSDFVTCTSPFTFPDLLKDGTHTFSVLSEDKVGNIGSSPASFNWTVDTVSPTTRIDSATDGNKSTITNDGRTKSASMTFTFSGNDTGGAGIDHFECNLDDSDFVTCTSPFTFPDLLKDGTHTFSVLSEDKVGNIGSSPASFNWTIDTVPPSTSITSAFDGNRNSVTAGGNITSTSMTFAFSGTDIGTGVNHFECSLDGASSTTCTSPVQFSDLADGAHTLEVTAEDNVVNVDASPASFAWTIDNIPPTTSIDSVVDSNKNTLSNGSNTRSNSITFAFSGSDTSKGGLKGFECSIDNSEFAACTSPLTFPNLLSNGPHTFNVRAEDNSGNNDKSPEIFTWNVDATPPDTTIDSANDGNNNTVTNSGNTTSTSMTFSFSASDIGVGLDHFECSIDGATFTTCTTPVQFNNLSDGSHTLEVRAEDKAGNEGPTPTAFIWTVNTKPPNTTINSVTDGNKNIITNNSNSRSNTATIAFSAIDVVTNVDHFECSIDNSDFAICTSPFTFPNLLSDGPHTFKVRAADDSGHEDPSPALYAWAVDTVAPTINITSATDGNKNSISADGGTPSTSMTFTFSGIDTGVGVNEFECSLDGASFAACTSPAQFDNLGSGAHTLDVRAVDNVGNQATSPVSFRWNVDATPPDTTINSAIDGNNETVNSGSNSTSTSMRFTFSGTDIGVGLDHFECSLDGAPFSICDSPFQSTGLSIGAHTLEVRAKDKVGNQGETPTVFLWTITSPPPTPPPPSIPQNVTPPTTTPPPSIPQNVTPPTTPPPSIPQNITTSPSVRGNESIVSNGTQIPTSVQTPDTKVVSAVDGAGNAVPNDSITPSNSIIFVLSGSIAGIEDDGTAGISTFECSFDGKSFTSCTSPVQYSVLTDGAHILEVRSLDNSGNKDPSPASFTWTVDKEPPDTILNAAIDGNNNTLTNGSDTESTTITFNFSGIDTGMEEGEEVGINHFECSIDGSPFSTCTSPVQYDSLANGSHTAEIMTVDNAGNEDPSPLSFTWNVNTVQQDADVVDNKTSTQSETTDIPDTVINTSTDGSNNNVNNDTSTPSSTMKFEFSSINVEGIDHFECSMDDSDFVTCTSPFIFPNLPQGKHVFMVRFVDFNGNMDESPATFVWDINR